MKQKTHANILQIEQDRKFFTNHRLHLNDMGKETFCVQLKAIMEEIFVINDTIPIHMEWIAEQDEANKTSCIERSNDTDNIINNTRIRTSNKKRKVPNNRNENFYGKRNYEKKR